MNIYPSKQWLNVLHINEINYNFNGKRILKKLKELHVSFYSNIDDERKVSCLTLGDIVIGICIKKI